MHIFHGLRRSYFYKMNMPLMGPIFVMPVDSPVSGNFRHWALHFSLCRYLLAEGGRLEIVFTEVVLIGITFDDNSNLLFYRLL